MSADAAGAALAHRRLVAADDVPLEASQPEDVSLGKGDDRIFEPLDVRARGGVFGGHDGSYRLNLVLDVAP